MQKCKRAAGKAAGFAVTALTGATTHDQLTHNEKKKRVGMTCRWSVMPKIWKSYHSISNLLRIADL